MFAMTAIMVWQDFVQKEDKSNHGHAFDYLAQ